MDDVATAIGRVRSAAVMVRLHSWGSSGMANRGRIDLHAASRPDSDNGRFDLVSAVANIGGLGLGSLVAGALAQFASAPLRTPYVVFAVLLLLGLVAVGVTPETVEILPERPRYRPQRISLGHADTAGYVAAAASAFLSFAVFGLFASLAPGFVAGILHHPGRLLAGSVAFIAFGAAVLAQSLTARLSPQRRLAVALFGLALGLVVVAAGVVGADIAVFLIGGALAGAGAGMLFKSALGTVVGMATAGARGEALAGLFLTAYLGLIIPAIGVGLATRYVSVQTAMIWFTGVLLAILVTVAVLARVAHRR